MLNTLQNFFKSRHTDGTKVVFLIFLLFISNIIIAQTSIKCTILDSKTKQTLAYCNVFNKSTQNGVISNEDGEFLIRIHLLNDIISISFLGYETLNITARKILNLKYISLKQKQYHLQEVVIHSDNDYLIDVLDNCKKVLKRSKQNQVSKAFFILNTTTNQQPLELLECYYNANQKNGKLNDLFLKNGRFALLPSDNRIFLNLSTTRVFNMISLTEENDFIPSIILQFNKRIMKKKYIVKLVHCDSSVFMISFNPKENVHNLFSGEIWIDKNSYFIKKMILNSRNIDEHPFIALGNDSLANVSLKISYTFTESENSVQINHIAFKLQMEYCSYRSTTRINSLSNLKRNIEINTMLYLYDFGEPFILPYFDYDNYYRDYRKISIVPYNKIFWQNRKLLLTKDQEEQIEVMKNGGIFINYDQNNYGTNFMQKDENLSKIFSKGFWEHLSHLFWSANERIILKKDILENQTNQSFCYSGIPSDMYDFKIQIFLDINPIDGVFDCKSYSVFDLTKTFYWLETNNYSNVFVNIYFDICEIERRKMEKELNQENKSLTKIDSIYNNTLMNIEKLTTQYKKDVQRGNKVVMLKKWNDYVLNELGINNFQLFDFNNKD